MVIKFTAHLTVIDTDTERIVTITAIEFIEETEE